ncbi:MAG TPA: thioredoxin [Candidatus Gracilibacteria bacterium]
MAHQITSQDDFKSKVLESHKPVIVDFYAPWCGPCQTMLPVIDAISHDQSEVEVVKVNIDETPEIAQEYGVMGIPTFIGFHNGTEKGRHVGITSKEDLLALAA